jgi:hypothetical protein
MRKAIFPLAFIGTSTLMACSFSMRAGSQPQNPQSGAQNTNTARPAASTAPAAPGRRLGKRTSGPMGPTPTPTSTQTTPAPTPTTPPAPSGAAVITGATIFGSGTVDTTGFKGNIYFLPAGTTKIPALASMQPNGFLFTKEINVAAQPFSGGFPGVDGARKENFAIRYEAPLIVTAEADYDFRLVADDGANLLIDNTPIVDNDGAKTAPAEKTGPVHLVAGTHLITVDYFQTTGNVALQLFCKKANDTEKVCPTQL